MGIEPMPDNDRVHFPALEKPKFREYIQGPPPFNRAVLPFTSLEVSGNSTIELETRAVIPFRPLYLIIPKYIGISIDVMQISIANTNYLLHQGNERMDGYVFRETLRRELHPKISYPTLHMSSIAVLRIYNHTVKKIRVSAHFEGVYS